jgi:hypothetical protein
MINIEKIRLLNMSIEGEDIETFINLLDKLLIASNQTGFKAPFNAEERALIRNLAEELGLDNETKGKIVSEKGQVKEEIF